MTSRVPKLNEATQAWVELEHNREHHSEIGCSPVERWQTAHSVARDAPSLSELQAAFAEQVRRKQRRSDGTITVDGVRFELPARYRHLGRVTVRKRSWDLHSVLLVDPRLDKVLCRLHPLDKQKNADRRRAPITPATSTTQPPAPSGVAPLLRKLLADYAVTGLPPAYLPLDHDSPMEDDDER